MYPSFHKRKRKIRGNCKSGLYYIKLVSPTPWAYLIAGISAQSREKEITMKKVNRLISVLYEHRWRNL